MLHLADGGQDGVDVVVLHVVDRDALARLRERCDGLGVRCPPVQDRGENEAVDDDVGVGPCRPRAVVRTPDRP